MKSFFLNYFFSKKFHKSYISKKANMRLLKISINKKTHKFGKKNKNKKFYVIKKKNGGGLFSNFFFVLSHLEYANKIKRIPIVDMENFPNFNSEVKPVNNTENAWLYYFEPLSKYKLKDIYNSANVKFSDDKLIKNNFRYNDNKKRYIELFNRYKEIIKIKPAIKKQVSNFIKKNFQNKKVLGVHWRGTDYKYLPNHPLPPTEKQIFRLIDDLLLKYKFEKIFVITEVQRYLEKLIKKYKNKICFYNSFRSNDSSDFLKNKRPKHKYKLGLESLIEVLIMSKVKSMVGLMSNVSGAAIYFSNNKDFKFYEINNGYNSSSIILSSFKWYLKKILPEFFFGFKYYKKQ